jgi:hypothetical protein
VEKRKRKKIKTHPQRKRAGTIAEEVHADAGHTVVTEELDVRRAANEFLFKGREGFNSLRFAGISGKAFDRPWDCAGAELNGSFDFGDAANGGIFLELERVVSGDDALGIAAGELDHALLIFDVGGVIGLGECGAGFVLGEVAV